MGSEKKQTFCVVVGSRGEREVLEGLPGDGERMERRIEAASLLAAYKEAFGKLPDIDPGIRELVVVLNEIPGMRTWSSCEGHKRHDDPMHTIAAPLVLAAPLSNRTIVPTMSLDPGRQAVASGWPAARAEHRRAAELTSYFPMGIPEGTASHYLRPSGSPAFCASAVSYLLGDP